MIITGDAKDLLDLINEEYGVIVGDIPWPYDNDVGNNPRWGGYTYQSMKIDDILSLPVPSISAKNCVLYLWGTWPKLPYVLKTLEAWEFEYVTGFPWVKIQKNGIAPVYRCGHWVAGCSEFVFIGRRGKVSPPPDPKYMGIVGPSFEHSRKPDSIHEMVEDEKLPGPYLELFARRSRAGWDSFGNDVQCIETGESFGINAGKPYQIALC